MIPALKIGLLAMFFAAFAPLQLIAVHRHWAVAGRIPLWFHRLARRMLGLKVQQIGSIAAERPLLIVSNHSSWIDIVTLGSIAPLSFVAKSEVSTWPAVRTIARLQRTIFVDRTRRSATGRTRDAIGDRLSDGLPIVLFAEGTTSDGQRVLPYRSALFGAVGSLSGTDGVVQPVIVAYPRRNGLPVGRAERPRLAWHGDMDLAPHLWPLLAGGAFDALVVWGAPIPASDPAGRKALARDLEAWARTEYETAIHGRTPSV